MRNEGATHPDTPHATLQAVGHLKGRAEGMLLAERLELFSDRDVSYRTCMFTAYVPLRDIERAKARERD